LLFLRLPFCYPFFHVSNLITPHTPSCCDAMPDHSARRHPPTPDFLPECRKTRRQASGRRPTQRLRNLPEMTSIICWQKRWQRTPSGHRFSHSDHHQRHDDIAITTSSSSISSRTVKCIFKQRPRHDRRPDRRREPSQRRRSSSAASMATYQY
jgi:hypothetical protein